MLLKKKKKAIRLLAVMQMAICSAAVMVMRYH